MNRDHWQHRNDRDTSRFNDPDRSSQRGSRYGNSSRYEDTASNWNDAQTARWLSHYGGASQRGERDYPYGRPSDDDRTEYGRGYGSDRGFDNPRYGQRFQESWEGYAPEEPWRQRSAERISPGMHGRYGWRGEEEDQGALNFQPDQADYGDAYGPTFGSTYRQPGRGLENYAGGRAQNSPRAWRDEHAYHSEELRGAFHGRGPSGYTRSDERIREDVCDRLTDDPHVDASSVQVMVENGVVTLQGQVPERRMKHRAEDCAEHVSGVKDVENRLRVNRGDAWNEDEGSESLLRKK